MVDFVVFSSDADLNTSRALITMMLPLRGVILRLEDGAPKATFAKGIVMLGMWTENTNDLGLSEIMNDCLKVNGAGVLVVHDKLPAPDGVTAEGALFVHCVEDGVTNRALISEAIDSARGGAWRTVLSGRERAEELDKPRKAKKALGSATAIILATGSLAGGLSHPASGHDILSLQTSPLSWIVVTGAR